MEHDSGSNWFSVETLNSWRIVHASVLWVRWDSLFCGVKKEKKSRNFLTTFHSWVRRQWCSLLASSSWLKCAVVAVLVKNTIERRADGRDSVKGWCVDIWLEQSEAGDVYGVIQQVKWKIVGESLDFPHWPPLFHLDKWGFLSSLHFSAFWFVPGLFWFVPLSVNMDDTFPPYTFTQKWSQNDPVMGSYIWVWVFLEAESWLKGS